jgi:integrase
MRLFWPRACCAAPAERLEPESCHHVTTRGTDPGRPPGLQALTLTPAAALTLTGTSPGPGIRPPSRIKGASAERSPERPVLTVAEVYALADAVGRRYRALVLLACFCGLRWGELAALCRCNIDTDAGSVRVTRQLTETPGQPLRFGPPKSDAGRRVVVIPPLILADVAAHLDADPAADPAALAVASPGGQPMRATTSEAGFGCPR